MSERLFPAWISVRWSDLPPCNDCAAVAGEACWNKQATRNPVHVRWPHAGRCDIVAGMVLTRRVQWLMVAGLHVERAQHEMADQVCSLALRGGDRAEAELTALTGLTHPHEAWRPSPLEF